MKIFFTTLLGINLMIKSFFSENNIFLAKGNKKKNNGRDEIKYVFFFYFVKLHAFRISFFHSEQKQGYFFKNQSLVNLRLCVLRY